MKITNIIEEGTIFEQEQMVARGAANASEYVLEMLEDIQALQELVYEYKLPKEAVDEINNIIKEMETDLETNDPEAVFEAVDRQFRRYGDKFLRQYRCKSGPKSGRLVASPEACGKRKDPKKVRQGKASARRKKGQRVRKTLFTKRRTQSKRLSRMNKILRGDA
jgi:hypothetical protein